MLAHQWSRGGLLVPTRRLQPRHGLERALVRVFGVDLQERQGAKLSSSRIIGRRASGKGLTLNLELIRERRVCGRPGSARLMGT